MNARQPLTVGGHRAMQAEHLGALVGTESLDELSFQQLLDLQDEASEDDSFDTFNDVSRELKTRRDDAKTALVKLFITACGSHGTIPVPCGREVMVQFIVDYLREALGTNAGTTLAIDMVMSPFGRDRSIAALAAEYANEQCEDLLRAGWTA